MVEERRDEALGYIALICLTREELKILTHDSFIYIFIQLIIVNFFGGVDYLELVFTGVSKVLSFTPK